MAFPWGALLTTTLLFLVAFSLPNAHAAENDTNKYNKKGELKKQRPAFAPTGWKKAKATFYDGDSKSFGIISYFHYLYPNFLNQKFLLSLC